LQRRRIGCPQKLGKPFFLFFSTRFAHSPRRTLSPRLSIIISVRSPPFSCSRKAQTQRGRSACSSEDHSRRRTERWRPKYILELLCVRSVGHQLSKPIHNIRVRANLVSVYRISALGILSYRSSPKSVEDRRVCRSIWCQHGFQASLRDQKRISASPWLYRVPSFEDSLIDLRAVDCVNSCLAQGRRQFKRIAALNAIAYPSDSFFWGPFRQIQYICKRHASFAPLSDVRSFSEYVCVVIRELSASGLSNSRKDGHFT